MDMTRSMEVRNMFIFGANPWAALIDTREYRNAIDFRFTFFMNNPKLPGRVPGSVCGVLAGG